MLLLQNRMTLLCILQLTSFLNWLIIFERSKLANELDQVEKAFKSKRAEALCNRNVNASPMQFVCIEFLSPSIWELRVFENNGEAGECELFWDKVDSLSVCLSVFNLSFVVGSQIDSMTIEADMSVSPVSKREQESLLNRRPN